MRRNAFSLVEILAVIGILAVIAAFLFPVFAAAKDEAKKTTCVGNLKQMHYATALYQDQWGGSGRYGDAFSMGLPPIPQPDHLLDLRKFKCSMAPHPIDTTLGTGYTYYYVDPDYDWLSPTWAEYASEYQDAAILHSDPFHNPASLSLMSGLHVTRLCLGVNLGGSLVRKRAKGDWQARLWWHQ